MDYQIEQGRVVVNCGSRLEIGSVDTQMTILKKVLSEEKPIVFRASNVTAIDTASLQIFLSFTLAASHKNIIWEWDKPTYSLLYVADLMGVRKLLRLPEKQ